MGTSVCADDKPDLQQQDCAGSVSYTHLDVYKRQEQLMAEELHVVRNQKDTVFRMLFREKKELLELYNALNDKVSSYLNSTIFIY